VFEPRTAHSMKSLQSDLFPKTVGSDDQANRVSMEHSLPKAWLRARPFAVSMRKSHGLLAHCGHDSGITIARAPSSPSS
jgi:hypothetical protein